MQYCSMRKNLWRSANGAMPVAQHPQFCCKPDGTAPPVRSAVCLYTCAPDADFVIGPRDGSERITVVSACSGHGFKHSAAVGEHAVRLITEGPSAAIAAFDPRRLAGSQLT